MSKKILLADDSITIQKVIELTFSDEDFEVVTVGNGRLAIERVQDVRPDLVLCDIIMPEKDGYEVCDFIKKNPALSRTPVLLLTGAFEPFDQERATRVGCDGFLAKPFEPQTLIAKVKDLLGRAGSAPAAVAAGGSAPAPSAAPATAPPAAPAWTKHPAPVTTSPAPQPEPFAFVPEPPPTHEPPRPAAAAMPFEEAGVSFFTDETFEELQQEKPAAAPAARSRDTAPVPTFPETPDFAEYRGSAFDEVAPAAPTIALTAPPPPPAPAPPPAPVAAARPTSGSGAFPALDEEDGPQTLLHVSSEEMATLRGEPSRPAAAPPPPPPSPAPAPVPARAPLWTQQTMEVPLETRARVAREASQAESEPVFEEVFEPAPTPPRPSAPPPPPAVSSASRPPAPAAVPAPPKEPAVAPKPAPVPRPDTSAPSIRPSPAPGPTPTAAPTPVPAPMAAPAASMPAPVAAAVAPAVAAANAPPARASQQDPETVAVRGGGEGGAVRSSVTSAAPPAADAAAANAAGVSVPVDMVSQIAQRVVAQISEKVIREVAWEVIPDLAEILIKKEIERLKAELQQT